MLFKDSASREERKELARFSFPNCRLLNVKAEAFRCGMSPLYAMKDNSSPISELIYVGICRTVDDDFVRVSA